MNDNPSSQNVDKSEQVVTGNATVNGDIVNNTEQTIEQTNYHPRSNPGDFINHNLWLSVFRRIPNENYIVSRTGMGGVVSLSAGLITLYSKIPEIIYKIPFERGIATMLILIGAGGLFVRLAYPQIKDEAHCPDCGRDLAMVRNAYEKDHIDRGKYIEFRGKFEYFCEYCGLTETELIAWTETK